MHTKAFEALHVAATAIKALNGITDVSVDNDGSSGEILFDVGDQRYVLRLVEEQPLNALDQTRRRTTKVETPIACLTEFNS